MAAGKSPHWQLVSAVIRRKKGNGTGPSAASAIQAFVLMVCFHWQQTEGGLQNRQRCEDEDKSTETNKSQMMFSCTVMIKLKR